MTEENLNQILYMGAPIALVLVLLVFVVMSVILNYHWGRYGVTAAGTRWVRRSYYGVSAVLFIIMLIGLFILQ